MGSLARPLARSLARSLVKGAGVSAPFDPASLFGASDEGAVFDFSDSANLFQASNGTSPVTATGQTIGYATDLSGKNHPATQATAASRPYWSGVPRTLGTEMATALSTWTAGVGWVEALGTATAVAGSASTLSLALTLAAGTAYRITYTITRTAGTVVARLTGGTTVTGVSRNTGGSFTDDLIAVAGNMTVEFSKDATFAGTVRLVSVKAVTSFTNLGASSDASAAFLQTAAINATGSDKMTLVVGFRTGQIVTAQTVVATGNFLASLTGSTELTFSSGWLGRLRGDTNSCTSQPPAGDTGIIFNPQSNIQTCLFDLAGATIATEVSVRTRGYLPTQTTAGTTAGGGSMANSGATILRGFQGANRLQGTVSRFIAINRTLTADEILAAEAWCKRDKVYAAVLGDSAVAVLSAAVSLPVRMRTSSQCGGLVVGAADLADSGDRIADQLTLWNALAGKTALEVVIVQIGLNDVKGRVGANLATTAQVIADYQSLITTIRSGVSASCKIYVSALTPCKVWLDAATNPAAAYAAWQDVNTAIAGGGGSPITGVDGRITSHVALMSDGSDNLAPVYDYNNDGVHPSNEGGFINAQAWRTMLEADGLLEPAA